MEDKNHLNDLFNRYLNNECSQQEWEVLIQHFGSETSLDALKELVRKQLEISVNNEVTTNNALPDNVHEVLEQAYKNIVNETFLKRKKEAKIVFLNRSAFVKLTACVSILILAVSLYFGYIRYRLAANNYRQVITLNGERKKLQLTDGTTIWLAPGSTLNYASKFIGKNREVTLRGEAFFNVTHDKQHPFIIHTGRLNTIVYGTTFNIQAYPKRGSVEVSLLNGKVSVTELGQHANQLMLAPNQRAIFNKTNGQLYKENYSAATDMLARRDGKFIYKGTTLSNVVDDISKAYNVTVVLNKKIQDLHYYGEFDQKENLQQVLMQISLTTNVKLKNNGAIWELY
ncbi:FecR family protein [Mucilaginibacter boryungensis]|uniref:FecR family protein n=1 Tax=Mucilaginibacter boryungensis TaxID=768480 RepID=A0ABR9XE86_9SPHI|nr:FecR domain-containing protein [Mucilaginibacter boryungensis]MBE9665394.1 FecR family protein [Mucilaginibacter boryungensis]